MNMLQISSTIQHDISVDRTGLNDQVNLLKYIRRFIFNVKKERKNIRMKIVSSALLIMLSTTGFSQGFIYEKIFGYTADSASRKIVDSVKITASDSRDKILYIKYSNKSGYFELNDGIDKIATISFSHPSFKPFSVSMTRTVLGAKSFDSVFLAPKITILTPVVVNSTRPTIRQELDRVIYDVQSDPTTKGENGFDIVKKAPFLTLDEKEKILFKGSSNYKVLLNGKPSPLLSNNLKEVLRGMPQTQILRIEVITTPPAKYDADDIVGLINVVTAKRLADGYNGTLSGNYSQLYSGLSSSINSKFGKSGLSALVGSMWETLPRSVQNSSFNDIVSKFSLSENGQSQYHGANIYSNIFWAYEIDSLNLLSLNVALGKNKGKTDEDVQSRTDGGSPNQSYFKDIRRETNSSNVELSLNYQYNFKTNKNKFISFATRYFSAPSFQNTITNFTQQSNIILANGDQENNTVFKEATAQIDYSHTNKKSIFEVGFKTIYRENRLFFCPLLSL